MEDRRVVFAMLLILGLILFWPRIIGWVGGQFGYDMTPRQIANPTTQPVTAPTTAPALSELTGTTMPSTSLHAAAAAQPASSIVLGSATDNDKTYRMAVTLSSQGAGIEQVLLNEFKREARDKQPYVFEKPYDDAPNISRPLATQAVWINGAMVDLSAVDWALQSSDQSSATYTVTVNGESNPQLRVVKTFHLLPASDASGGYEVAVDQSFENLTDQPMTIHTLFTGPTTPPVESDRGGDRSVLAGFVRKNQIEVSHDTIEGFTEKQPSKDYTKDSDGNPAAWAGISSIYFNALVRPLPQPGSNKPLASYVQDIRAGAINPAAPGVQHQIVMSFTTGDLNIAPGQTTHLPLRVFFGPRQRQLLNSAFYSAFPLMYDQTLVLTSGVCGYCTFQWLVNLLVWLLNAFHYVLFRDWGLAIIALVIIVRVILHPITKRSQISMAKMSKMGPEMERLKKKYADNKDELNKAMMEFYKTQGATPILGCLPMFLQTPIWIALWQALQTTFELRQAPFLQFFGVPLTWIHDLSKPDHLITLAQPFQFWYFPTISGLNLLPILMGVVFYLQTKFQPKPAAMTPEQVQQQKMMTWMMPVLFPLMLYGGPSGLNLYILTSTGIGIIEAKIIRDHIKEREEEEKAGKVIVDAGKKFKGGGGKGGGGLLGLGAKPKKPNGGGWMGWIAELQNKAEQLRREADKRK